MLTSSLLARAFLFDKNEFIYLVANTTISTALEISNHTLFASLRTISLLLGNTHYKIGHYDVGVQVILAYMNRINHYLVMYQLAKTVNKWNAIALICT